MFAIVIITGVCIPLSYSSMIANLHSVPTRFSSVMSSFRLTGCSVARSRVPGRSGGRRGLSSSNFRTFSRVVQNCQCPARRPLPAFPRSATQSVLPGLHPSTNPKCHHLVLFPHDQRQETRLTNRQFKMTNKYLDIALILTIGGIEPNPAPHTTHIPRPRNLRMCHVNINSITAPGRLDELHQFVDAHCIDIPTGINWNQIWRKHTPKPLQTWQLPSSFHEP